MTPPERDFSLLFWFGCLCIAITFIGVIATTHHPVHHPVQHPAVTR